MNSPYIHERDLPELDLKKWSVLGYIHMADRIVETDLAKQFSRLHCSCSYTRTFPKYTEIKWEEPVKVKMTVHTVEIKTAYWSFPSLEMTIKMRMGLCEGCLTMYYWTDIA